MSVPLCCFDVGFNDSKSFIHATRFRELFGQEAIEFNRVEFVGISVQALQRTAHEGDTFFDISAHDHGAAFMSVAGGEVGRQTMLLRMR